MMGHMMKHEEILSVQEVSFGYRNHPVLQKVSLPCTKGFSLPSRSKWSRQKYAVSLHSGNQYRLFGQYFPGK